MCSQIAMSKPLLKRAATKGGHLPGDQDVTVRITIVKARELAAKQAGHKFSDAFCLVRLGNVEQRTKTILRSLNPAFEETFEFERVSKEHGLLRIALYDADPLTADHFLGEVIVPVCSMTSADESATWRPLEARPGSTEFVHGELCIRVTRSGGSSSPKPAASPAAKPPTLKRQSSSVIEQQSFGATPYSRTFVIDPAEISFKEGKVLGQGGFGTVQLGHFRGLPVAVKTLLLRDGVKKAALVEEFRSEVAMLAKVSHHPKLCLFLGASVTEPLTVVSELMTGSVRNVLDKPRPEAAKLLSWPRRVGMLLDAALGMAFLHGMAVVHRDLKADNLLLDEHGVTKVADFGLSKTLKAHAREHCDCGTPGFKAPEMYDESEDGGGYSLPVDTFAFGATIYELLSYTGKNWGWPYGWALDLATDEQVEAAVVAGKPPTALGGSPVPSDCPAALRAIYQACVGYEPESRPTFEGMVPQLRELLKTLREDNQGSASSSTEGNGAKAEGKKRKR